MSVTQSFQAFIAEQRDELTTREVRVLSFDDLPSGEITVRVEFSSVNYKDGLATIADGKVARISPLVPGIDLAGEIVASETSDFAAGEKVIVHGYGLGVSQHGGFAEYARVPASWVVPLPDGLTTREAMGLGTAGFTAALSVYLLEEQRGLRPGTGPVLVTGASGGVGSVAVGILASRGYEVVASTGKPDAHDYLRNLGAADVVSREQSSADSQRPLEKEHWAGAVDPVGGATLEYVIRTLRYGGTVAASGNTGGATVRTTVFPFILRGVALLGVDSVQTPIELRWRIWQRLATDLRPRGLDTLMTREIGLEELEGALDCVLEGRSRGRTVVRLAS